jgi:ABC-type transport system involved in multi-copper enzyme maturation permease subunit
VYAEENHNEIILGVLLGYYMRGNERLLVITLTFFVVLIIMCSVVLPAIALSMLGAFFKTTDFKSGPPHII